MESAGYGAAINAGLGLVMDRKVTVDDVLLGIGGGILGHGLVTVWVPEPSSLVTFVGAVGGVLLFEYFLLWG